MAHTEVQAEVCVRQVEDRALVVLGDVPDIERQVPIDPEVPVAQEPLDACGPGVPAAHQSDHEHHMHAVVRIIFQPFILSFGHDLAANVLFFCLPFLKKIKYVNRQSFLPRDM
jgi:hypothetical protein